jgi:hypothetical protein
VTRNGFLRTMDDALVNVLQKRRSAFVPWAAVDLSKGVGCRESTRNGFSRATDDPLVDFLTGGQRHPWMVQLLPRGSNINKLFIAVQENCPIGGNEDCSAAWKTWTTSTALLTWGRDSPIFTLETYYRPYLGCIHPESGHRLWYLGLPMGSSQSPALGCWYGLAMLQKDVFQGTIHEDSWRTKLAGNGYHPEEGTCLIRKGRDGLPAALKSVLVDDFMNHAPTWEKLIRALNTFEQEMGGNGRLHWATLFYLTDNLLTYCIVCSGSSRSPELQKHIHHLKSVELTLAIRLEVVHVQRHSHDQPTHQWTQ